MVIWTTGLSGSGKTTLCNALYTMLKNRQLSVVKLDGDQIRQSISTDLGYHEADRVIQIQRIQRLARLLSDQDIIVLVSALYARDDLLQWNRDNIAGYFEVYIKASFDFLRERDAKKFYSTSSDKVKSNVVGIDIPWHEPKCPDITFEASDLIHPDILAQKILSMTTLLSVC